MVEGRNAEAWSHTSSVLALIANVNRDPKKRRAFKPADFNPYAKLRKKTHRERIPDDELALLRDGFNAMKKKKVERK